MLSDTVSFDVGLQTHIETQEKRVIFHMATAEASMTVEFDLDTARNLGRIFIATADEKEVDIDGVTKTNHTGPIQ